MHALVLPLALAAVMPRDVPPRPVATYSIVARDARTGELGVAVQSHWFSVGPVVPWAEAGVGAVATQSFVEPSYGPLGLALMMRAARPRRMRWPRSWPGTRSARCARWAWSTRRATSATFTGKLDIPRRGRPGGRRVRRAGEPDGEGRRSGRRWRGRSKPRRATSRSACWRRSTPRRRRAATSAAGSRPRILVVKGTPSGRPWADRTFDLRVEDHPDPLAELRRLVGVQRAYNRMGAGDECVALKDWACAEREYGAAEAMMPDNAEMAFWHAVALASNGRLDAARPLFRKRVRRRPAVARARPAAARRSSSCRRTRS